MPTVSAAFEEKLREALKLGRQTTLEEMGNGLTLEAYHQRVGYVRAIKMMEEACDEIREELEER